MSDEVTVKKVKENSRMEVKDNNKSMKRKKGKKQEVHKGSLEKESTQKRSIKK